jgi:ABC-type polysaccharide/polyol phosphate export permease
MDPTVVIAIVVVMLLVLLAAGVHIGVALGASGMVGMIVLIGWQGAMANLRGLPYNTTAVYSLAIVPMFILMGAFFSNAGFTRDSFQAAAAWLGRIKGGLAAATVVACAVFGAVTGSSVANAAVFSRIALPEMVRQGIDKRLAAGCVAASGTLASLIPPSLLLVVFAIITEQSVRMLLLAGIIPGFLSVLVYLGGIFVRVVINPELVDQEKLGEHLALRQRLVRAGSVQMDHSLGHAFVADGGADRALRRKLLQAVLAGKLAGFGGSLGRQFGFSLLVAGLFAYFYTRNSLNFASKSVFGGGKLIMNTAFPRALLPVSSILTGLLMFVPTIAIIFLIHAILGQPFGTGLVTLPLIIAILTVFNLGLGMFIATLTVYFRDTKEFLPYFLRIWLYLTPILYRVTEIPASVQPFLAVNPLYPTFAALQQTMSGGWPSPGYLLGGAAWALVVAVLGGYLFLSREREFAVRI